MAFAPGAAIIASMDARSMALSACSLLWLACGADASVAGAAASGVAGTSASGVAGTSATSEPTEPAPAGDPAAPSATPSGSNAPGAPEAPGVLPLAGDDGAQSGVSVADAGSAGGAP